MANHRGGEAAIAPAGRLDDRPRELLILLDAARVLMLCGAVTAVSAAGIAAATKAIVGLLLWLLGVCLLALVPVARRFALVGVARATAGAVLKLRFAFTPWRWS